MPLRKEHQAMQAVVTAAGNSSNGGTESLNSTLETCTETVTFAPLLEEEEWRSFYYSFKTEQLVTLWILFVITVVGNSIVLISIWKRKRKSRMTFFVTQLALTGNFVPESPLLFPLNEECC